LLGFLMHQPIVLPVSFIRQLIIVRIFLIEVAYHNAHKSLMAMPIRTNKIILSNRSAEA